MVLHRAHYDGFPAVLVRLAEVPLDRLEDLIVDAWRCQAPKGWSRRGKTSGVAVVRANWYNQTRWLV